LKINLGLASKKFKSMRRQVGRQLNPERWVHENRASNEAVLVPKIFILLNTKNLAYREFWTHLSERLGIALMPSSAFHSENNGQRDHVNASIEQYLWAFVSFHQDDWADWLLAIAEFASNNVVSETTNVSAIALLCQLRLPPIVALPAKLGRCTEGSVLQS
jgi:hypothetical protein